MEDFDEADLPSVSHLQHEDVDGFVQADREHLEHLTSGLLKVGVESCGGHVCSPVVGVLGQAELHDHGEAGPTMAHTILRRILVRNKFLVCCVLA